MLGDTEGLTDTLGETETLGDTDGLLEGLTDTLGDTDGLTEGLLETDGLTEGLLEGLLDGEMLGETETLGEDNAVSPNTCHDADEEVPTLTYRFLPDLSKSRNNDPCLNPEYPVGSALPSASRMRSLES